MPLNDFGTLWLAGIKEGAGIMDNALNRNLRIQELRSAEALRQMEEKQIAQHLSMQLYQHNMMVDAQADHAKAAAAMQADMLMHPPTIQVQKPIPFIDQPDEGTPRETMAVPNPNGMQPEDAYLKNFLPVLTKWNGVVPGIQQPVNAMAEAALVKERRRQEALAGQARPRTPEQTAADVALANQRNAATSLTKAREDVLKQLAPERLQSEEQLRKQRESQTKLNEERINDIRNKPFSNLGKEISDYITLRDAGEDPDIVEIMRERIGKGVGYSPGAMQKSLDTIESYRAAGKLNPDEAKAASEIVFGLRAKESAAGEWLQRTEVVSLIKQRGKLQDSLAEEESKLDKLKHGYSLESTKKKKQAEVAFIQKKIDDVNKEIDKFRPASGAPATQTAKPQFKVGEIVRQNGKRYKFDGSAWTEIQ